MRAICPAQALETNGRPIARADKRAGTCRHVQSTLTLLHLRRRPKRGPRRDPNLSADMSLVGVRWCPARCGYDWAGVFCAGTHMACGAAQFTLETGGVIAWHTLPVDGGCACFRNWLRNRMGSIDLRLNAPHWTKSVSAVQYIPYTRDSVSAPSHHTVCHPRCAPYRPSANVERRCRSSQSRARAQSGSRRRRCAAGVAGPNAESIGPWACAALLISQRESVNGSQIDTPSRQVGISSELVDRLCWLSRYICLSSIRGFDR